MTHPCHHDQLNALKRIEGQVRGVRAMIEEGRYCVDILTQLSAITSAVARVQDHVLAKHLDSCVRASFAGPSKKDKAVKIDEIVRLVKTFRKRG